MEVLYEDNHLLIVNKAPGEIVQGDKTGDEPLVDICKAWLKETHAKPGNVFLGVVHRLDRPVGGVVVFAKTSKALTRMNEMFRQGEVEKTYWALTRNAPSPPEAHLTGWITSDQRTNKSHVTAIPRPAAKEARLSYRTLARSDHYSLLEVTLETGRKHQIRCQLASIGCPVRGDVKYGDRRAAPAASIALVARNISFVHPVSGIPVNVTAPLPVEIDPAWTPFADAAGKDTKFTTPQ